MNADKDVEKWNAEALLMGLSNEAVILENILWFPKCLNIKLSHDLVTSLI